MPAKTKKDELPPVPVTAPALPPVKLMHELATVPKQARPGDLGFDLCTVETVALRPQARHMFDTGVAMAIDETQGGFIWPRSKLASKYGIMVLGGVIEPTYRGAIKVVLYNSGDKTLYVNAGDAIAQLILHDGVVTGELSTTDELPESNRGIEGIDCDDLRM